MDKKKAAKKIKRTRLLYKLFIKKRTSAEIKYVDTSYGKIRVLEYGFNNNEVKPLYVDIHGGGYCVGIPEMNESINNYIMKEADVKIISIDYPKAPEHPYPIGQEAAYEVVKHYYDNAEQYKIDKERIGTGGHSSGGNFATVIPMKAKERDEMRFRYQVLCYPGTNISEDPYAKQGSGKVLTSEFVDAIKACYITKEEHAYEPYASPCLASKELLTGLPPALMMLGDIDLLYHECVEYSEKLKEAGVDVETHVFEGADHGFILFKKSKDREKALEMIAEFIKRHSH
ncbi:MAG: alpha/beta hydrolase [Methanomassiliicoccaceae archaeon]|nr:alpha/beta hydrolase [Methanomassiliicoccaceae archaeon]